MSIPSITIPELTLPLPEATIVLDVREPDEWAAGHIDGATHIPLSLIPLRADELSRDQPLLVICKAGGRSAQAVQWLNSVGYDATNITGGMMAWESAGRPMVADASGTPYVV